MPEELLYDIKEGWVLLAVLFLFMAAFEAGYRLGFRAQQIGDGSRSQLGTVQGAVLGLLALLLAFSSSMALSRYDMRKSLVMEEANAIGTTYLRAKCLEGDLRGRAEALLRDYAKLRLTFYDADQDDKRRAEEYGKAEKIHRQLWWIAVAASTADNRSVPAGLFMKSLNDVIDLHTKRITATNNHVPESILFLLIIASVCSLGLTGYGAGVAGNRHLLSTVIFIILVSITFMTILDLDRPRRGLIKVSQQSMIDLNKSMETEGW